MIANNFFILWH